MEINTSEANGELVVQLRGDLDVYSTEAVEKALMAAIERCDKVVVDIAEVPFADSSGLGGLISVYKKAKSQGAAIRLRRPTPVVSEILTITRMKRFFPVEE